MAPELKPLLKVVPTFIVLQIWKRKNVIAHGKMSRNRMKMGINGNLCLMAKSIYRWLINLSSSWLIHPNLHLN